MGGKQAVANITRETGNSNVDVFPIDLSSFASVKKAAAAVLAKHPKLDILICDAGTSTPRHLTEDGFEWVMQVNYIGHFLLQRLLLPTLRASPAGKVINVASGASYEACAQAMVKECTTPQNIDKIAHTGDVPANSSNYGLTKFMQVYESRELTIREKAHGSNVRAFTIRPGFVDTPLVRATVPPATNASWCNGPFKSYKTCPMPASAGACSPTFISVTDMPEDQAGDFYYLCEVVAPPTWLLADKRQTQLFDLSLKWTNTTD